MTTKRMSMFFLATSFFVSANAYSDPQSSLYTIDETIRYSQDAVMPIAQSVQEWNMVLDPSMVTADNDQFEISLPVGANGLQDFSVVRSSFRKYASGNSQWVGKILSDSIIPEGTIVINMINDQPFGFIKLNGFDFDIYTDNQVGTRLAEIDLTGYTLDAVPSGNAATSFPQSFNGVIEGTSVVDVLVVIDEDLADPGSNPNSPTFNTIMQKIEAERMNADLILQDSANGVGVPLILNVLPPQFIQIPSDLEAVVSSNFATLTAGVDATSIELMNQLNTSGADLIALYVPFDPAPNANEFCGMAGIAESDGENLFRTSFSVHANSCTESQFVFLHEILHNFGAVDTGNAFPQYGRGFTINPEGGATKSTVMDCTATSNDPITNTCSRIMQLSSPLVEIDGLPIGVELPGSPNSPNNADMVRLLTECIPGGACRRGGVANRGTGSDPLDEIPTINITDPTDNQAFNQPIPNFTLTASANDDNGIASVTWSITQSGMMTVELGEGTGSDFRVSTTLFSTPGTFLVSAKVIDSIDQESIDTHQVTVSPPAVTSVTLDQGSDPFDPFNSLVVSWLPVAGASEYRVERTVRALNACGVPLPPDFTNATIIPQDLPIQSNNPTATTSAGFNDLSCYRVISCLNDDDSLICNSDGAFACTDYNGLPTCR